MFSQQKPVPYPPKPHQLQNVVDQFSQLCEVVESVNKYIAMEFDAIEAGLPPYYQPRSAWDIELLRHRESNKQYQRGRHSLIQAELQRLAACTERIKAVWPGASPELAEITEYVQLCRNWDTAELARDMIDYNPSNKILAIRFEWAAKKARDLADRADAAYNRMYDALERMQHTLNEAGLVSG